MRMRDLEWWNTAPRYERMLMCRRALSSPLGPHHDAALEAGRMGDTGAVPHLIDSLRWQSPGICGYGHALKSLRQLTGADAGQSYEEWARWWEEHKPDT